MILFIFVRWYSMGIKLLSISGSPYLGVYIATNNNYTFLPKGMDIDTSAVAEALDTEIVPLTIGESHVIGSLVVMNDNRVLLPVIANPGEKKLLDEYFEDVMIFDSKLSALGNNILIGKNGIIAHPDFPDDELKFIEEFFAIKTVRGTVARMGVVGSATSLNTHGILVHPKVTALEKEKLKDVLGYDEIYVGTANYGVPFVGACMVANDNGIIVGNETTGIELNRIEDALL